MIKLSITLALIGAALLLASALPQQTAAPVPASVPTAAVQDQLAYGKALFLAKGCVSCHRHNAIPGSGAFGEDTPNLTSYRRDADFLRAWLKDPAAIKPGTAMPTLGLKPDEIEALITFLRDR